MKMEKLDIFLLFVNKQLMILRFQWKTLVMIVTALLGLQFFMLYFMHHPIEELKQYYDPENPYILVNMLNSIPSK